MGSDALVALSGGVDSSLSLFIASRSYRRVRAAWVRTLSNEVPREAERVAVHLGIPLEIVEGSEAFAREVIEWSGRMLSRGLTPNPCARCNAMVKLFCLHEILRDSEDLLTGHYARMENGELKRGLDVGKDQSYFLSMVDRKILDRCAFPLGTMRKEEVRTAADRQGLPFRREESMDLCFDTPSRGIEGPVLDVQGRRLGTHSGIECFTVGQRKGLGAFGRRMYVVSLDPVRRTVTIGERQDLLTEGCTLEGINWLATPERNPFRALVQTRYRRRPVPALLEMIDDRLHIDFETKEEAVAPGQVCALYQDSTVMGGGIITDTRKWKGS